VKAPIQFLYDDRQTGHPGMAAGGPSVTRHNRPLAPTDGLNVSPITIYRERDLNASCLRLRSKRAEI
jgi:hypothetical protein